MIEKIIIPYGYSKKEHGFTLYTGNILHGITVFSESEISKSAQIQMFGYFGEEKEYDTGIVNVSASDIQTLIKILLQHK